MSTPGTKNKQGDINLTGPAPKPALRLVMISCDLIENELTC